MSDFITKAEIVGFTVISFGCLYGVASMSFSFLSTKDSDLALVKTYNILTKYFQKKQASQTLPQRSAPTVEGVNNAPFSTIQTAQVDAGTGLEHQNLGTVDAHIEFNPVLELTRLWERLTDSQKQEFVHHDRLNLMDYLREGIENFDTSTRTGVEAIQTPEGRLQGLLQEGAELQEGGGDITQMQELVNVVPQIQQLPQLPLPFNDIYIQDIYQYMLQQNPNGYTRFLSNLRTMSRDYPEMWEDYVTMANAGEVGGLKSRVFQSLVPETVHFF